MFTETSQLTVFKDTHGFIFFDGECTLCANLKNRWERILRRRNFTFVPLQAATDLADVPFTHSEMRYEMKLRTPDGTWFGGVAAYVEIFRTIWWLRPLAWLLRMNRIQVLADRIYKRIARLRHCHHGSCIAPARKPIDRWLPLLLLPGVVILFRGDLEPWVIMWALAFAIFTGFKWLTFRDIHNPGTRIRLRDALAYLMASPAMNSLEFFNCRSDIRPRVRFAEVMNATARLLIGAGILWLILPNIEIQHPLVQGWLGMFGMICILHFGVLDLMGCAARALGWNAKPLMVQPLKSRSLAEFWGRRWNTAFNDLGKAYVLRPLAPWIGARGAMFLVFAISGLIHDLVITLPAGGGHGLPTLYFLIQAGGLFAEKYFFKNTTTPLRRLARRAFAIAVITLPIGLLFPPTFVHSIILPMLNAIGAN